MGNVGKYTIHGSLGLVHPKSSRTLSAGGLCQQVSDSSSGRWMAVFTDQPGVTWSKTGKESATPWLAAKHLLLQKHWAYIKIKKSFKSGFHTIFETWANIDTDQSSKMCDSEHHGLRKQKKNASNFHFLLHLYRGLKHVFLSLPLPVPPCRNRAQLLPQKLGSGSRRCSSTPETTWTALQALSLLEVKGNFMHRSWVALALGGLVGLKQVGIQRFLVFHCWCLFLYNTRILLLPS